MMHVAYRDKEVVGVFVRFSCAASPLAVISTICHALAGNTHMLMNRKSGKHHGTIKKQIEISQVISLMIYLLNVWILARRITTSLLFL
jgi:orotate phosphoribosyltransferase